MARDPLAQAVQTAEGLSNVMFHQPQQRRLQEQEAERAQEQHEMRQQLQEQELADLERQRELEEAQREMQAAYFGAMDEGGRLDEQRLLANIRENPTLREDLDEMARELSGDPQAQFAGISDQFQDGPRPVRAPLITHGDGSLDVLADGDGPDAPVYELPAEDPSVMYQLLARHAPDVAEKAIERRRQRAQRRDEADLIEQLYGGQAEGLEAAHGELVGDRTVPEYAHDQLAPMEATLQASQALERHPEWQDRAAHQATDTARGALGEAGGRDDGVELGGALGTTGLLGAAQSVGDTVADGSLGTRAAGLAQTGYQHAANVGRGGVRALLGEDVENRLEGLSQSLEERISGAASGLRDAVTGSDAYQRAADTFDFVSRAEPTAPGQEAAFEEQGGGQPEGQDRLRELQDGAAEGQRPERSAAPTTLSEDAEQQLRRAYGQGIQRAQQAQDLDQRRQLVQRQQQKVGPIREAVEQGVIDLDTGIEMLQAGDERELELREVDGDLVAVTHDPNDPDGSIRTQTVAGTEEGPLDEVRDHQALADYRDTVATQADIPQEGRSSFHAGLDMATQRGLIDPVSMTDQGLADTLRQVIQGDVGRFSSIRPGREYSSWEDVPAEAWVDATLAAHAGYEDLGDYRDEIAEPVSTMLEEHGMGASHEAQQRAASTMARLMRDAGVSQDRARQDVQEILQRHPQMLQLPPDRFNQFVNNLVANERQQGG